MHIEATEIAPDSVIESDICLIGAGAAGITIARELKETKLSLCLLESGPFDLDLPTQELYRGSVGGNCFPEANPYPHVSRLRYFGGTTNHWSGWCRPLDRSDFEARPWVAASGWPFGAEALEPYYERAAQVVQIRPFDVSERERRLLAPPLCGGDDSPVTTSFYHYSPPTRFGKRYREELVKSERVQIVTRANVTNILLEPAGSAVRELHVRTLGGTNFVARAKRYVLACGGIENARILLSSRDVHQNGIGNQFDFVGRYFADHPHFRPAGLIGLTAGVKAFGAYRRRTDSNLQVSARGVMTLKQEVLKREQLLNMSVELRAGQELKEGGKYGRLGPVSAFGIIDRLRRGGEEANSAAVLVVRTEQAPNPESRVLLTSERDALGLQRVKVEWRLMKQDYESTEKALGIIARTLGVKAEGRIRLHLPEMGPTEKLHWGKHHMGTTRMHVDPKRGVVNPECRVHGVQNLFVAGSSVFPTYGYANPTLTIVAMALRLADHLKMELAS